MQGVGSEAYLNGTSQGPTPEDARLPARRAYSSERRTAISVVRLRRIHGISGPDQQQEFISVFKGEDRAGKRSEGQSLEWGKQGDQKRTECEQSCSELQKKATELHRDIDENSKSGWRVGAGEK